MKEWYLLSLWFDDKVLKFASVRAVDATAAYQAMPYGWKDYIGDDGPAVVMVHKLEVFNSLKDFSVNAVNITESAS